MCYWQDFLTRKNETIFNINNITIVTFNIIILIIIYSLFLIHFQQKQQEGRESLHVFR